MRIIPAIDIINGKCVRLSKGDYESQKVYNENPLEVARQFEDNGIQFLHLVDLDGARNNHVVNHRVLEEIASKTRLKIDFGGGLKTEQDLRIAFECGAKQVTGGSIAVTNPTLFEEWIHNYGPDKIILGADVKNGRIATHGWKETSQLELIPFVKNYLKKGIKSVICTDVSKDGMLQGPSFSLYENLLAKVNGIRLIASGGISKEEELPLLQALGCEGVIIGKAIYENKITLKQLRKYVS